MIRKDMLMEWPRIEKALMNIRATEFIAMITGLRLNTVRYNWLHKPQSREAWLARYSNLFYMERKRQADR